MKKKEKKIMPKEIGNTIPRDISWMYFNHRILEEARRAQVPLLERLSFLGIYSNNLDEFFRVRVSSIRRVLEYEPDAYEESIREEAQRDLKSINKLTKEYLKEFEHTFEGIKKELEAKQIFLIDETQLNEQQANYIRMVYRNDLNSSTYPLMTSQGATLNELTDSEIYLAVKLTKLATAMAEESTDFALLQLPTKEFGRFLMLPEEDGRTCIMFLDDAIRFCLPYIFAGLHYDLYDAYTFKFTRDAEIELYPGMGEGLVEKIARGVRNRKKGEPVRLVYDKEMPKDLLRHLKKKLNIDHYDTTDAGSRYHNMKDLMAFPTGRHTELRYPPQPSVALPHFNMYDSTLDMIRARDFVLHYPYHNFSNYIRLLREAAISQEVTAIKTTVYRLAKDSKVVKALICAAMHGKRVTVVVELLARFDESSNINWAKKMQAAGIHVIYGMEGLKVHAKLTHISSVKGDVACVSTGNFHEGNARTYTDVTLFTARPEIVEEVGQVFHYIKHPLQEVHFQHLLISPKFMRRHLYKLIQYEIDQARQGNPAYLWVKINHVTDEGMMQKLYEASAAGVDMRFLVRGNCSLVTGVPGVSDRIEIRGIIDRYLEHSRILIFCHGGNEKYYIGSADWMARNLDSRIETYVPVYDPEIQAELKRIIEYGMQDNQSARIVDGSGYNFIFQDGGKPFRSQEKLYEYYARQSADNLKK